MSSGSTAHLPLYPFIPSIHVLKTERSSSASQNHQQVQKRRQCCYNALHFYQPFSYLSFSGAAERQSEPKSLPNGDSKVNARKLELGLLITQQAPSSLPCAYTPSDTFGLCSAIGANCKIQIPSTDKGQAALLILVSGGTGAAFTEFSAQHGRYRSATPGRSTAPCDGKQVLRWWPSCPALLK